MEHSFDKTSDNINRFSENFELTVMLNNVWMSSKALHVLQRLAQDPPSPFRKVPTSACWQINRIQNTASFPSFSSYHWLPSRSRVHSESTAHKIRQSFTTQYSKLFLSTAPRYSITLLRFPSPDRKIISFMSVETGDAPASALPETVHSNHLEADRINNAFKHANDCKNRKYGASQQGEGHDWN